MQELRFQTLTQQGFEIWPSTQHDFSAAGHQLLDFQTTLKPATSIPLTQPNEKMRVSAICHVVSEGGRANMENSARTTSNVEEMALKLALIHFSRFCNGFILTDKF